MPKIKTSSVSTQSICRIGNIWTQVLLPDQSRIPSGSKIRNTTKLEAPSCHPCPACLLPFVQKSMHSRADTHHRSSIFLLTDPDRCTDDLRGTSAQRCADSAAHRNITTTRNLVWCGRPPSNLSRCLEQETTQGAAHRGTKQALREGKPRRSNPIGIETNRRGTRRAFAFLAVHNNRQGASRASPSRAVTTVSP